MNILISGMNIESERRCEGVRLKVNPDPDGHGRRFDIFVNGNPRKVSNCRE